MQNMFRSITVCAWLLSTCLLGGCRQLRRADWYLIPAGYIGWIQIEYKVSGASLLPQKNGHNELKIPASGSLKTSSVPESGAAKDEYFYVDSQRTRKLVSLGEQTPGNMIWGEKLRSKTVKNGKNYEAIASPTMYLFFVGTKAQFFKASDSQKGAEKIGNLKAARSHQ